MFGSGWTRLRGAPWCGIPAPWPMGVPALYQAQAAANDTGSSARAPAHVGVHTVLVCVWSAESCAHGTVQGTTLCRGVPWTDMDSNP